MKQFFLATIIVVIAQSVYAQDGHVHDHAAAPVVPLVEVDPAHQHQMSMPMPTQATMEPETAPEGARDPHAYSAGFTQTEGLYALENARPMMHAVQDPILSVRGDWLEFDPDSETGSYKIQAWYGSRFDRFLIKSEGDFTKGNDYANTTELLWGHALTAFWDSQVGVRVDSHNNGTNRNWLAAGVQGLAPYWFEVDATAYLGRGGQTELVFDSDYDWRLTQRLILQPRIDFTLRGKDDPSNLLGSGLGDVSLSLRLRYEFTRQFAPYFGVTTEKRFGNTAKFMKGVDMADKETSYFAGIRFWF